MGDGHVRSNHIVATELVRRLVALNRASFQFHRNREGGLLNNKRETDKGID